MKLLKRFSSLSPIYRGGLTNHLPMVIIALDKMGVPTSDIEEISEQYIADTEVPDLHESWYPKTPFEEQYISLSNTYINLINSQGIQATISNYFEDNKFGLFGGLFHGLIRLYYALEVNDELQIAQALAYNTLMEANNDYNVPFKSDLGYFNEVIEFRKTQKIEFKDFSTYGKLTTILEHERLFELLFKLEDIGNKESELVDLFTEKFLLTKDFYILHVVTGFHALHSLKEYFENYDEVLNNFFVLAQIFMLFNDYSDVEVEHSVDPVFETPLEIGELRDAHQIKLLGTCYDLQVEFNNDNFTKIISYIKEKG